MLYIGNNEITAYLAFQINNKISQSARNFTSVSMPEDAYFINFTDDFIKDGHDIYIIDITSFLDDEEILVTEIDKLCRATNADIIIDAPSLDINSRVLTSLRALGYDKIITDNIDQSKIKMDLQQYLLMPKVSPNDINDDLINNREELFDEMYSQNPVLAKMATSSVEEEDTDVDVIDDFDFIPNSNSFAAGDLATDDDEINNQRSLYGVSQTLDDVISAPAKHFVSAAGVMKIAVVGSMPRIGTTTVSMQLVKFFNDQREFSAAYLQKNNSSFIRDMKKYYRIEDENENDSKISFANIEIFYNPSKFQNIIGRGYQYIVYDYGSISVLSNSEKNSIFENDIILLVGGCEPDEVAEMTAALEDFDQKNVFYIFSFVPEADKEDIYRLMEDEKSKTYFMPYCPDRYVFDPSLKATFNEIMSSDYRTKRTDSGKKRRTGRLFR